MKRRRVLTYMSVRFSILATAGCSTCRISPKAACESWRAVWSWVRSISSRNSSAMRSTCARRFGGIFATARKTFVGPSYQALRFELLEIRIVEVVSQLHVFLVKPILARLVANDEQDRLSARIEGIENAQRIAAALHPQFAHMGVPRSVYARPD